MKLRVETHSGYKADEYPVGFWINDQMFDVIDIEDRWYGPDCSYFKVFANDAKHYILRQDRKDGVWEVTPL
jgi:hypothetical protein